MNRRLSELKPDKAGHIFTSDLSVNEFLLVKQAGFQPLGLVLGTSVYHVGLQVGRWSQNQEMGVLSQAELARLPNPSMAYVLRAIVGEWGATVIIIGSIISVLGALLAWVLLCAEVLYAAAGDEKPNRESFRNPIADYYLTNPIARASAVMAECSALAAERIASAAE